MAISSGIFSTFSSSQTVSFLKLSPSSFMLLAAPPPSTVNLRTVRTVTSATASSQQQQSRPRGIMIPRRVSSEMAELVGASEISRTQALKLIWAYIKEHNLQFVLATLSFMDYGVYKCIEKLDVVRYLLEEDPNNKKVIICDEKLKKLFGGRDSIGFLEVAGLISPHFLK